MSTLNHNPDTVMGKKYAFATVSLIIGIASFVNLFGIEKAALAILFGWVALRRTPGPPLIERRGWAKAGILLGSSMLVLVLTLITWKWDAMMSALNRLKQLP